METRTHADVVYSCIDCNTMPDTLFESPLAEYRVQNQLHTIHISKQPTVDLGIKLAVGRRTDPFKPGDKGLFISTVSKDSLAEKAGIKVGDTVLSKYVNVGVSSPKTATEGTSRENRQKQSEKKKKKRLKETFTVPADVIGENRQKQSEKKKKKRLKETFTVPADVIGTVIGNDSCNIKQARSIPGVYNIKHTKCDQGFQFSICGENEDALKEARSTLELHSDTLLIPKEYAGGIIGQYHNNLDEIVSRSYVHQIICCEVDEGVNLKIIGKPDAIKHTKDVLNSYIDKLKEDVGVSSPRIATEGTSRGNRQKQREKKQKTLKESFTVPEDVIGTVIGTSGCNIKKARSIPGICCIKCYKCEQGFQFDICAQNEEALKEARSFLELHSDSLVIPTEYAGRIIGKCNKNIDEIVSRSSVHRIVRCTVHEGVNLKIIGKPDAVEHAKDLLTSQLDRLKKKIYGDILTVSSEVCHIKNLARKIEGVISIQLFECDDGGSMCYVRADSIEALQKARTILKCHTDSLIVPFQYKGEIIGKGCKKFNDIVSESSVYKILQRNVNEGIKLEILGTLEAIETAKTLLISKLTELQNGRKMKKTDMNINTCKEEGQQENISYTSNIQKINSVGTACKKSRTQTKYKRLPAFFLSYKVKHSGSVNMESQPNKPVDDKFDKADCETFEQEYFEIFEQHDTIQRQTKKDVKCRRFQKPIGYRKMKKRVNTYRHDENYDKWSVNDNNF